MPVRPLIDPDSVRQVGLSVASELPARGSTFGGMPLRGVVQRVYPVGHAENRRGQVLVDVRPVSRQLPVLRRVPLAFPVAHVDTSEALPASERRQPFGR